MDRDRDTNAFGQLAGDLETAGVDPHRRALLAAAAAAVAATALPMVARADTKFRRVSTQYIAALGAADAQTGDNAQEWGLWRLDPGPRGVRLNRYPLLERAGGVAPADWKFDSKDWWLEEHGLIMEQPEFPLPPGHYVVTGGRNVTSTLTVHTRDVVGRQRWELADGATIYDVTHLRCRSARYTPGPSGEACSPEKARMEDFPVNPGAAMPPVEGCSKQDYAVLIVIGMFDEA